MPKTPDSKSAAPNPVADIDPKLISALICPKSRGPLKLDRNTHELISKKAKLAYPIREGVPIMLIEEARKLEA